MSFAPTGFNSWQDYSRFALAREFAECDTGLVYKHQSNLATQGGALLSAPFLCTIDKVLSQFRNPSMIAALTTAALIATAFVFYPASTWATATTIFPFLRLVTANHLHFALFTLSQMAIAGLGLRTLGRLSDRELLAAFQQKRIEPVPMGAVFIKAESLPKK